MAKEKTAPATEAGFPITLGEFLSEAPKGKVETVAGFTHLCKIEGITGHKTREEWAGLMTLFETQPTSQTWAEWASKGGK